MTTLRRQMIQGMVIRGLSDKTQGAYPRKMRRKPFRHSIGQSSGPTRGRDGSGSGVASGSARGGLGAGFDGAGEFFGGRGCAVN
jgi:hypothetical protein